MSSTAPHTSGKRHALMVSSAGLPERLVNEMLEPRGFAPVTVVPSVHDLAARMRTVHPAVVITPVESATPGSHFDDFAIELRRVPGCIAIGTSPAKDADIVLAAMRAGVLEFLVVPASPDDVRATLTRVLSLTANPASRGQVFTVYAAKGGLGMSTIAASLSWELARRSGGARVALADFTTTGAGMRVMLNINPTYDLGNIASRTDRIDRDFVRSVMVHDEGGVDILAAAEEVDAVDPLDMSTAGRLFDALRDEYAYTVVDTDHHFAEPTLAALDAADRIVIVTQLDVSALRSTQRTLGVLARLGYPAEKIVVVANRRSDRDRIELADVEQVLRRPVTLSLPNDYGACASALTRGEFVQRHAPNSPLVGAFATLAGELTGTADPNATPAAGRSERSKLFKLLGIK